MFLILVTFLIGPEILVRLLQIDYSWISNASWFWTVGRKQKLIDYTHAKRTNRKIGSAWVIETRTRTFLWSTLDYLKYLYFNIALEFFNNINRKRLFKHNHKHWQLFCVISLPHLHVFKLWGRNILMCKRLWIILHKADPHMSLSCPGGTMQWATAHVFEHYLSG